MPHRFISINGGVPGLWASGTANLLWHGEFLSQATVGILKKETKVPLVSSHKAYVLHYFEPDLGLTSLRMTLIAVGEENTPETP